MILNGTIDVPIHTSSERVDIMPKYGTFDRMALFFSMILSLPLELAIGISIVLSDIVVIIWHYKVSEISKSVGAFILIVKLCT